MRPPLPGLFAAALPLLLGASPAPPPVDDIRYGGRAADPVPLQPSPVRLRSTAVQLVEVPVQDGWQVTATYELHNPGGAPAALTVVLPEQGCPAGRSCSPQAGVLQDLGTRFGEALIEPIAAPAANAPERGPQYALRVPPRRPTPLVHEYRLDRSLGTGYSSVEVQSAAGRWGGPIEKVRYVIELKRPPLHVIYPQTFKLAELSERPAPGGSTTRIVFTAANLAARTDFRAFFPGEAVEGRGCPGYRGEEDEAALRQLLARQDAVALRGCRELVQALHGFPFQDPALRARYYAAPKLPTWAEGQGLTIAARPENPAYRESLLSPGERAYLRALAETERRGK